MAQQPSEAAVVELDDFFVPGDGLTLLSDGELLILVRGGSPEAYGVLY
jgi:hypothetical protein